MSEHKILVIGNVHLTINSVNYFPNIFSHLHFRPTLQYLGLGPTKKETTLFCAADPGWNLLLRKNYGLP